MENKLNKLVELTLRKNEVMNLTAITDFSEFFEKMVIDSIKVDELCHLHGDVLDIGSGAGFPGLPLAINNPNINIFMLDATNKKVMHINDVMNQLDIKNARAFVGRAEEFIEGQREKFDFVISRAVSSLNILLELCVPYAKVGGYIIAMKGPKYLKEIELAQNALKKLNAKIMEVKEYILPNYKEKHYLLIIKKINETSKKYPRDYSLIKSKPL